MTVFGQRVLDQLAQWPAAHAAAAVIGPAGVLETHGDQDQPFRLASLTKPLAALAVLRAVEEEALLLSDPLPAPLAAELPGATVEHLLAHASGIDAQQRRRLSAAGARRIYSNVGFDVLGELVTAATGIAFAGYLREAVFEPLRMSGASLSPASGPGLPGSPASGGGESGSPAKDGVATARDFTRLLGELLIPSGFLDPSTLASMSSVHFPGLDGVLPGFGRQTPNDWGLGFEIRGGKAPHWTSPANSARTYGHFGQSGTMFWIDPVARLGLVALTNHNFDAWATDAWPALSTAVLDAYCVRQHLA